MGAGATGTLGYDSSGVDRSAYPLTSTFNGNKGYLYGIELNDQQQFTFLPGALDGFGFQGNITYLDGKFDTADRKDIGFPGTADRGVTDRSSLSGWCTLRFLEQW